MKRVILGLTALVLSSTAAYASHDQGGEIHYKHLGASLYEVTVNVFKECVGPALSSQAIVTFEAASCGQSFSRGLPLTHVDTLDKIFCTAANASCSPGGLYKNLIATYRDTVTMTPCSDWVISRTTGTRDVAFNIPGSMLYIEATLDNSNGHNSSPILANHPPFYTSINGTATPQYAVDIEGDSIVYEMVQPRSSATTPIPYSAGYSLSSPTGAPVILTNNYLYTNGGPYGSFTLAMRVKEYRNNILIGTWIRDWITNVYPGLQDNKAPFPVNPNDFVYNTCPGQQNSITLSFEDSVSTDSVYVSFEIPSIGGYNFTSTSAPAAPQGSGSISFTTPNNAQPGNFLIRIHVTDKECTQSGYAVYPLLIKVGLCNADSVWPGDANDDNVVNLIDPLAIALAAGTAGPARPNASLNWVGQYCPAWVDTFSNGVNKKHADCDGNGTVALADLAAVVVNYGLVHPKGDIPNAKKTSGLPDLTFDIAGIDFVPGATVSVPLVLGNASSPVTDLYGLSAKIKINSLNLTAPVAITYPANTLLGAPAANLQFVKEITNNNLDWAYSRMDNTNSSGHGALAMVNFTVPADAQIGQSFILHLEQVTMVDNIGNILTSYNVVDQTAVITWPLSVSNVDVEEQALIAPNPSNGQAQLIFSISQQSDVEVVIMDVTGKKVWQNENRYGAGNNKLMLPANLNSGIYTVQLSKDGQYIKTLKWVRQ